MARIPYPDLTDVTDQVELIRRERDGRLPNLFRMHLHNPNILEAWMALGTALRYQSSVDDRSRELAICYVARLLDYDYQLSSHQPLAEEAGIPVDVLEALPAWREHQDQLTETDVVVLAYAEQVSAQAIIEDSVFDDLAEHFNDRQIMELTATVAFYGFGARFLKSLEIRVDDA